MTKEAFPHSQQEIDHFTATRIMSDADLLQGGAEIINGNLLATQEQISELAIPTETEARSVGRLVLHSELEESIRESSEGLDEVVENQLTLLDQITTVTTPYSNLFAVKIPDASENEKTIFERIKGDKPGKVEWSSTIERPGVDVKYDYTLLYEKGEEANSPLSVSIDITNALNPASKDYDDYARLKLNFDGDAISKIELFYDESIMPVLMKGSYIESLMHRDADKDVKDHPMLPGSVTIDLGENPTVTTQFKYGSKTIYRYDGEADTLEGVSVTGGPAKNNITREDFLKYVQSTLDVIPVIED